MAELSVQGDHLLISLSGKEKLGALQKDDLEFPIDSIIDIARVDKGRAAVVGIRAPGTGVPGKIALGTWRTRDGKDFVAAYNNDPAYVISLTGQRFDRLIISGAEVAELDSLDLDNPRRPDQP